MSKIGDFFKKLFEKLEFKSLIAKLPKDKWEKEAEEVFV